MTNMTAKERILSIRIIEKLKNSPKMAKELGIKAKTKNKNAKENKGGKKA